MSKFDCFINWFRINNNYLVIQSKCFNFNIIKTAQFVIKVMGQWVMGYDSPASQPKLGHCWPNVSRFVGPTLATNVGPASSWPAGLHWPAYVGPAYQSQHWPNVSIPTLAQRINPTLAQHTLQGLDQRWMNVLFT